MVIVQWSTLDGWKDRGKDRQTMDGHGQNYIPLSLGVGERAGGGGGRLEKQEAQEALNRSPEYTSQNSNI